MVKSKTQSADELTTKKKKTSKVLKKRTSVVVKKSVRKADDSKMSMPAKKRMIESEDIDDLLADGRESETDDVDDLRLTPKIRINKVASARGVLANDYVVALRNKRKSYVEDEESNDEDEKEEDFEEDLEDEEESEGEGDEDGSPDELPDLLPADEHISNHLEDLEIEPIQTKPSKSGAEEQETPEPGSEHKIRSVRIYKRIAIVFSVLVLVVLLGVLYFTLVKASIAVSLNEQTVSDQTTIAVYDRPQDFSLPAKAVRGLVKVVPVEQSKLYQVAGREVIGEEVVGQITLFNKYTKSQPLVASTRLLSASGKLYRLKNSVTVPAGGEVRVDIYADEAKPESVVGAELFTVPGLWEGLQDKIYGQSVEGAIKYQQKLRRIVAQDDIDKALADLRQVLKDKVKADIDNAYNDYDYKFYQLDEGTLKYTVSGKIGEEKDQLPVAMSGVVEVIAFSSEQAQEIARLSSAAKLPAGQDLLKIDNNSLKYELVKFDQNMVMAEVSMNYDIKSRVNNKEEVVDKNKIVGLSEDQLKQYLSNVKDIKAYNIEFYPSFIRQVPRLTDRIEVRVLE